MTREDMLDCLHYELENLRVARGSDYSGVEAIEMAIKMLEVQELSKNSTELDKGNGELHPTCTGSCTGSCTGNEELKQEVKNSIESSSTHKALDTISRQAAIDRINKQREHLQPDIYPQDKIGDAAYRICAEFIERLPSAQPEIIRCKDCRWRKDQSGSASWLPCRAIVTPSDFYCGRAERRTDEND